MWGTILSTHGSSRFLPTGAPLGESHLPHFVGGANHFKSPLFTPYPVIPPYVVRTLHSGMTDDREHSMSQSGTRSDRRVASRAREPTMAQNATRSTQKVAWPRRIPDQTGKCTGEPVRLEWSRTVLDQTGKWPGGPKMPKWSRMTTVRHESGQEGPRGQNGSE